MAENEEIEKGSGRVLNLDLMPYPAQATVVRQLMGSSDDILNMCEAFSSLAIVAGPSKTTWLFDKVFPILVRYLSRNDALKSRLVCYTWMQTVDTYLQNLGLAEPDYSEPVKSLSEDVELWSNDTFGLRSCWIEDIHHITDFMSSMGTHARNPFISRCVQINNRDDPQYWREVTRFLERFGHEIWKLRLSCYCSYVKASIIVRGVLKLTPNLRMLSMEFNGIDLQELSEEEEAEMLRDLEETPYPSLPNLIYLDWLMCTEFYRFALPQYSDHLVHVRFLDEKFLLYYDSRDHGTFPSLKTMVVRVNDETDLYKLLDMTCPLRGITTVCDERIPLQIYFLVFQQFSDTLETINIEYGEEGHFLHGNFNHQLQRESFDFPVLKCVRLENPDPTESLDSLLCLEPGPSHLQIQTFTADYLEFFRDNQHPLFDILAGEDVQIHGYLERMYESRIWETMPRLDNIQVDAFNPDGEEINMVYQRNELLGQRENQVNQG